MSNKKILTIGISVIVVCLLVAAAGMFFNQSTKREPTQQEIDAHAPYMVDWQAATGQEGTDREIILSLCTAGEQGTSGENVYQLYTSDTVAEYLYDFGTMTEICMLNDILYVQYTTPQSNTVSLGYFADGTTELCVYDLETDTLYFERGDTFEFWNKFRTGFQWGA